MVLELTRREFLLATAATGLAALTHAPFDWNFTPDQNRTLLTIARTLFPHDSIDDRLYQIAVDAIEARCMVDAEIFDAITSGLAKLKLACGGSVENVPVRTRVAALKVVETSRFFKIVYGETLQSLYGSPDVWRIVRDDASMLSA